MSNNITLSHLRECLNYEEETGGLFWAVRPRSHFCSDVVHARVNTLRAGKAAGTIDRFGYVCIAIDGSLYKAHRLAYFLSTGAMPDGDIDHINGVKCDNRMCNIRSVSKLENMRNSCMPSSNTSGVVGVSLAKGGGRWRAYISIRGKYKSLGSFIRIEDAAAARKDAEKLYGFHKNHGRAGNAEM